MNAVIIAAGQFPRREYPLYLLQSADLKVCCDGALTALEKRGIRPDVVIGDLDSVCGRALRRFDGTVVKSDDQETNDLTKAFTYIMNRYADVSSITILGATGLSEAHTVGNMSLLMEYERRWNLSGRGISVQMISDWSTVFAIGGSCELHVGEGRKVSLFANDPTLKIKSSGLQWPTDEVIFDNWWKATLNRASADIVSLEFSHPCPVLIILD